MFKVPQTKRKTRFWARPNGTYVYNIQGLDRLASDPSTLTKDLKSATATKLNPTNSTASVFFAGGIYIIGEGGTLFHPASTGTSGTSGTWASWALSAPTTSAVRYSGTLKDLYCLCSTAPYLTNTNDGDFVVVIVGADGVILRESRTLTTFVLPQLLSAQYREGGTIVVDYYGVSSDSSINSTTSKWVIVGENGIILYSGDNGQTWSQVMSGTAENLRSVTYGNGTWVIVGDNGTILKTQNPSLDYNVTGGWTTVPITFPADASTKVSKNLTHIKYDDTFNTLVISAPSGIYYSSATSYASITFTRKLQIVPSETLNLTRLARYGSPALISSESSTASAVDVQERIINGGIISGTILDVDYSPGQEVQYFLVVGNWKGNPVFVGQTMLSVMEYKV
jgi:hypothetical protein